MKLSEIEPKMRVVYVPGHAHGDRYHPDVERGTVSSKNHKYAFVRFDVAVSRLGWDGDIKAAADLRKMESTPEYVYEGRSRPRLSVLSAIRRIEAAPIPMPAPGQVHEALYPKETA